MVPFALMAAGTALQVYGQYTANLSQAQAEIQNANWYKKEASFALSASFREESISDRKYSQTEGLQVSAYGRGGVDISGSAGNVVADTLAQKAEEHLAIQQKGEMQFQLATLRSRQAQTQADTLSSPLYNLTQAGGTTLTGAARAQNTTTFQQFASGQSYAGPNSSPYGGTA